MAIILWLSVAIAAGVYICGPVVDPDLWWHITAGRWILSNGTVPDQDLWNMFGVGRPWRAYSWSFELLVAWLDNTWGVHGLLTAQLLLGAAISVSLCAVFSKLSRDWVLGLLLGIVATASMSSHFTLRPQSVTWILFAAALLLAERIDRNGSNARTLSLVALVMMAWANMHLSAILPLGALGLWLSHRWNDGTPVKVVAAGFFGTLVTPYMGGEWLTFLSKTGHPLQLRSIAEFQPANVMQYPTDFLILFLIVMTLLLFRRAAPVPVGKLLVAWGFAFGGFAVIKFVPLAMIAVVAVISLLWEAGQHRREQFAEFGVALHKLKELCLSVPREGLSFVALCTIIVNCWNVWQTPIARSDTPVDAVDYILSNNLPGPILNTFGDGGYLMYRLSDRHGNPSQLVSIDGRTNVTPMEVLKKHTATLRGELQWREYLDVVDPQTILWRNESPLVSILLEREDWKRVYSDGSGSKGYSVFQRVQ